MGDRRGSIRRTAMTGVLAALVFAGSLLQIPIPTVIDNTRLHLGNVLCLLGGLLLGPVSGGLAAGFGSLFYDLTNPLYIAEAPITFATKFAMGWICGMVAWHGRTELPGALRRTAAAGTGALGYVVLYLGKTFVQGYYYFGMALPTVVLNMGQKGLVSAVNGAIAVVAAVPLSGALAAALDRAHLHYRPRGR